MYLYLVSLWISIYNGFVYRLFGSPITITSFILRVVSPCWVKTPTGRGGLHTHTLTGVSACSGDALWAHSQLSVYAFFFPTHRGARERGDLRHRLCGFSSFLPTQSTTADDARLWTLISTPFIHQTGKSDNFSFSFFCLVVTVWTAAEAGSLVSSVIAGTCGGSLPAKPVRPLWPLLRTSVKCS